MYNDISPEGYRSPLLPFLPATQQQADDKDRKQTLDQFPLLKQVVKHLDDRLAATDSIEQALKIAEKHQISRDTALVALNIVRQQLETERGYIQSRINRATK